MSVDPWATRGTIPVQSAYSTIADTLGCCLADVYAPAPPSASATAPSRTSKSTADTSGCQMDSTAESRRCKSSRICEQAAQSPPSYPSPAASSSRHGSKPKVISTPRRNIAVSPNTRPAPSTNPLQCPFCSYEARHGRVPDIKQHLLTHTRGNKYDFLCCGVPLAQAEELRVPAEVKREAPLVYEGIKMVGGCWKGFSRRDVLARHLRSTVGKCFGDARAPYLLGNQRGH
ncbi:hypothetical protein TRAPUB_12880 [Trametes pubescens]|uniref:C2H2-type domain-containing protein n=1 Tax=Trametes pubescens TaxID=154538 RepID=A0A1M2VSK0_TRAPU|nr:hypothetical protein TRAPUB_12880 [Trametes pubescens]